MNPLDFLVLAKELIDSNQESEAKLRTSIGRSYYAMYLFVRHIYVQLHKEDAYIEEAVQEIGHQRFIEMLKSDDNNDIKSLSHWLHTLKLDRVKADYYIKEKITLSSAKGSYNKAERLKTLIYEKFGSS